jgi:hypothetical protein
MRVADVQSGHQERPLLAERLRRLQVHGRVGRFVIKTVAFEKP